MDMVCLGVPKGGYRECSGVSRDAGRTSSGVPGVEMGHDQWYSRWTQAFPGVPDDGDRAYISRVGTGWGRRTHAVAAPGCRGPWDMVTPGGTWNRSRQRSRGSCLPPRWEPQAGSRGPRAGEADPGAGRSSGRTARDPLLRDRIPEAAPRRPGPAQAPTSRLFSPLKKLSRDLGRGDAPTKRPRLLRLHANEPKPSAPIG